MKKAFTMLELIMVIVVIGILAAVMLPRVGSDRLAEAATQVISHIRYTQHLAMVDDKFDAAPSSEWYQKRWAIRFKEDVLFGGNTYSDVWACSIYSDTSKDGNPNLSEMAKNPLNSEQYLSGGYNNILDTKDSKSMKKLRIGSSYGISNVVFGGGCRSTQLFVHFDNFGRPFNSFCTNASYEPDPGGGYPRLLTSACTITLSDSSNSVVIAIEPETGYAHILP
jgi:prepilin-type N-terminal cleavage/methylation domain-containing protein